MTVYRIKKGVRPYPECRFVSDDEPDELGNVLGRVHIHRGKIAPASRVYNLSELTQIEPKETSR
jgi:hypothetical protein